MASATKSIAVAILALVGVALPGGAGAQDAEGSIELVDPHVFRACADPRDLPFSNEAGEGFENKIAELVRATSSANRSPTRSIPTPPVSSATR